MVLNKNGNLTLNDIDNGNDNGKSNGYKNFIDDMTCSIYHQLLIK